jgi:dCTP deaminase
MTVLANKQILEGMKNGSVIIDPFNEQNLGTSSYDVRLGEWYYREQSPPETFQLLKDGLNAESYHNPYAIHYYNIYSENHINKVWGEKSKAMPASLFKNDPNFDMTNIREDDKIIFIGPHENLLCHTQEFIGGIDPNTTMMKARSSIGRSLMMVCSCAGMGDVGYFNRWTMEVYNRSPYYTIPLIVGRRKAQIVFLETGGVIASEYSFTGKYQDSAVLAEIKANWTPEMMLPRLHTDRDIQHAASI